MNMKHTILLTLLALIVSVCTPLYAASTPSKKKKVVAVPVFVNSTSGNDINGAMRSEDYKLPAQAGEIAADSTASALLSTKAFRVLNRSVTAVKSLDTERAFIAMEGSSSALQMFSDLKSLNVDYILLGRINRYRIDVTAGEAYGVRRMQAVISISMDMQLLDIANGEVVLNKQLSDRTVVRIPHNVEVMTLLRDWEPIMRNVIEKQIPEFVNEFMESDEDGDDSSRSLPAKKNVSFEVNSIPEGADVEFDGCFVGNTPCTVEAPAVTGTLTISAPGYQKWEKKIVPNAKLKINPTLREENPAPAPAKKSKSSR